MSRYMRIPRRRVAFRNPEIELSPDKYEAMDILMRELEANREATLAGAAGTGKTTLMRALGARWKKGNVLLCAPTGKAAKRLSEVTGRSAKTIHGLIYMGAAEMEDESGKTYLEFGEAQISNILQGDLVIVDEASMVNEDLANDLRGAVEGADAYLLFVGDQEQLQPVTGTWGAPLGNATYTLTKIHRQALDSPVLQLATLIRQGEGSKFRNWGEYVSWEWARNIGPAVDWMLQDRVNRVLLTFTNPRRNALNLLARKKLRRPPRVPTVGEPILVTYNQKTVGYMNGETFTIRAIKPYERMSQIIGHPVYWVTTDSGVRVMLTPDGFDGHLRFNDRRMTEPRFNRQLWSNMFLRFNDPRRRDLFRKHNLNDRSYEALRNEVLDYKIQGTWGYALTVHKSQGSQWKEVGFVSDYSFQGLKKKDPTFAKRLAYTAVTRAAEKYKAFILRGGK